MWRWAECKWKQNKKRKKTPVCKRGQRIPQGRKGEPSQRCLAPAPQKFQLSKTSVIYGNEISVPWWKNTGGSGRAQLPWFSAGGDLALLLTFLNGNLLLGKWHEFCLIPVLLHIAICSHGNFHLFEPSTRLFKGQRKTLKKAKRSFFQKHLYTGRKANLYCLYGLR